VPYATEIVLSEALGWSPDVVARMEPDAVADILLYLEAKRDHQAELRRQEERKQQRYGRRGR